MRVGDSISCRQRSGRLESRWFLCWPILYCSVTAVSALEAGNLERIPHRQYGIDYSLVIVFLTRCGIMWGVR